MEIAGSSSRLAADGGDRPALNGSAERFQVVFRTAGIGMALADLNGRVLETNAALERMLGYSEEEFRRMTFADFTHPEDVAAERRLLDELVAGQRDYYHIEKRYRRKDGGLVWARLVVSLIRSENGQPLYGVKMVEDITEQKRMEEEISRQLRENLSIAELSAHLLSLASHEDISESILKHAQEHTQSASGLVGYIDSATGFFVVPTLTRDVWEGCEVAGKDTTFQEFRGLWGWVLKNKQPLLTNEPSRDPRACGLPEGHLPIRRFVAVPCTLGNTVVGEIAVANADRDYTDKDIDVLQRLAAIYSVAVERKRTDEEHTRIQEQLRQAQKLEAIGQLAGGVAHDFNNLLTVINGYSELLLSRLSKLDPLRGEVEEISQAGQKAASLTQQLLAFGRRQLLEPELLDLNAVVADIERLLRRLIGEHIDLVTVLDPELAAVRADPGQIQQVIVNLAVNARDAMPRGGQLIIETRNVELDENHLLEDPVVKSGPYVMLAVTDTGVGMAKETRSRLFEPFFTTKEPGKGTGLGLPMVYGIVKQSGGYIWVYSQPARGTTFKIYLPTAQPSESVAGRVEAKVEVAAGSGTVLVVEDESGVRNLIVKILQSAGYKMLEADNGEEALDVVRNYDGTIDLLVTDLVMPKMGGRQLAEHLEALRPGIKVLYISGYTEITSVDKDGELASASFLQKPFTRATLAGKVRSILEGRRPGGSILVVDHEPEIRRLLRRILEAAGYEVLESATGREATEQLQRSPVDLVITDLVMPEREVVGTIGSMRRERPDLNIIVMSGAFGGRFLKVAQEVGAQATLQKPLNRETVLACVRGLLG